jgi:hypothetical protein
MKQLNRLTKHDLVRGLKDVKFEKNKLCISCQARKQVANTHPNKSQMSTHRPLELLHMDLFGPTSFVSIGGNSYCLVIVDDYSRFPWVYFLRDKSNVVETRKLEVIMGRNSKMLELMNIVMTRVLNMNFLSNILRNKMVLLKVRIGLSLIWLGLC